MDNDAITAHHKCYEEVICKSTVVLVRIITVNNGQTMNYAEVTQFDLHFTCEFEDQIRLISSAVPRIGVRRTRFRSGPSIPALRDLEPGTRSGARWHDGDPASTGEL
ncbi:hypothetical protein ACQP0C_13375 [Nocardia sp. CA-129566]|uniref:hypothetical protein n=1 Tax=Nocardia sp. CA-129566 TaxID=3239976 RepID=UPI003D975E0A